jgi:protein phosphatase
VFGNIFGNYADLMRFFDIWKAPSESGDISGYDYLFLGNYVDKGAYSLEVVCLLMALKLKYPK